MTMVARLVLSGLFVVIALICFGGALDLHNARAMSIGFRTFGAVAIALLGIFALGASGMMWSLTGKPR